MAVTPQPASQPVATNGSFTSFADMVDYTKLYADLEQRGITLTDEEKKRCEQICGDRLRNHDGGQVIGNSFGGTIQGLVYTLLAFVQKLFGGSTNAANAMATGNIGNGLSGMAANFGAAMSSSAEQSKLFQLQLAESETYLRLQSQGGNLAAAAEYITGMKPASDDSPNRTMQASILNQVGGHINLPVGTNTSLNHPAKDVAEATPPTGLPPRSPTQSLTQRG